MIRFRLAVPRRFDGATPRFDLVPLLRALSLLALMALLAAPPARAQQPAPGSEASGEARRVFEHARERLVQIRTLALPSRAQASTGSGFLVAEDGLVVTNYHVVSQAAAEKGPYALEWVGVDASSGPLEIVAIDVRHDLALLRRATGAPLPFLALAPAARALQRGERVFSLGKPLDLGFVVSEGLYNGVVERDLYGHLLFSGALNAGMSGGPALDAEGKVIGINVARRLDGQLVSFLIPVRYLHELLAAPTQGLADLPQRLAEINRQLRLHQAAMVERVLAAPWPTQIQGPYRVPVLPDDLARCWGSNDADNENGLSTTSTQCNLAAERFVSSNLILGTVRLDHRHVESGKLTDWAFWTAMRRQFANRVFGLRKDRQRTPPRCEEADVETAIGAQRVVFCLGGYHRFEGLFQMTLLTMTLTHPKASLSGQLYADRITEANARRLAQTFLESMRWNRAP